MPVPAWAASPCTKLPWRLATATATLSSTTFAFNQAFQYKKIGPWKNYLYGEATYITLSLVAKSVLAWQVFSGAIIPAIAST